MIHPICTRARIGKSLEMAKKTDSYDLYWSLLCRVDIQFCQASKMVEIYNIEEKLRKTKKKKEKKPILSTVPYPRDIRRSEAQYGLRNLTAIKSFGPYTVRFTLRSVF